MAPASSGVGGISTLWPTCSARMLTRPLLAATPPVTATSLLMPTLCNCAMIRCTIEL